jgi:hypothetical protein
MQDEDLSEGLQTMITAQVELSAEEFELLENRAHELGYSKVNDYLRIVIEDILADDLDDDDVDIRAELKQGLREALRGETVPLESLWDDDEE